MRMSTAPLMDDEPAMQAFTGVVGKDSQRKSSEAIKSLQCAVSVACALAGASLLIALVLIGIYINNKQLISRQEPQMPLMQVTNETWNFGDLTVLRIEYEMLLRQQNERNITLHQQQYEIDALKEMLIRQQHESAELKAELLQQEDKSSLLKTELQQQQKRTAGLRTEFSQQTGELKANCGQQQNETIQLKTELLHLRNESSCLKRGQLQQKYETDRLRSELIQQKNDSAILRGNFQQQQNDADLLMTQVNDLQSCGTLKPKKLTAMKGVFSSPDYPEPYSHNAFCSWLITARATKKLQIDVTALELECSHDFIRIYDGDSSSSTSIWNSSCNALMPIHVRSTNERLFVTFTADHSVARHGFNASYFQF